jgi:ubiquinone/menaquinone biosynthesis C-methylase UbiE
MGKSRVQETDHGIVGEYNVHTYDQMMRKMRDRGWIETDLIIGQGITTGRVLEVGPGPGYIGLEWLKKTEETALVGLDISADMLALARTNAEAYGLADRVEYRGGDARSMPFADESFDAVFSNGSLHEWALPEEILNEVDRVLKPEGRYLISDLRRDMAAPVKWFLWLTTQPMAMRRGLLTSIAACYTLSEACSLLAKTRLPEWHVSQNLLGLTVAGQKPPC